MVRQPIDTLSGHNPGSHADTPLCTLGEGPASPRAQSRCSQGVRIYPSAASDFPKVPSPSFREVRAQGKTLCPRVEKTRGKAGAWQFGSGHQAGESEVGPGPSVTHRAAGRERSPACRIQSGSSAQPSCALSGGRDCSSPAHAETSSVASSFQYVKQRDVSSW